MLLRPPEEEEGAEAAAERMERRTGEGRRRRRPDSGRTQEWERGEGEELHASLVPPPPISERTDSSRGLTAARWFLPPSLSPLYLQRDRLHRLRRLLGWHRHMFIARHIVLMTACHPRRARDRGETREPDTNQAKMLRVASCEWRDRN